MSTANACATAAELSNRLCHLRFTQRQASFLAIVALSGGYCMRRQYATFAGIAYGATVRDFLERLVRRRWMTKIEYRRDRGLVYRLCATAVYQALDIDRGQGRRPPSASLIARKLMLLDVAVAHPRASWFMTEAGKVSLFTRLGVPLEDLPQRAYRSPEHGLDQSPKQQLTRYFVNHGPIFMTDDDGHSLINFVVLILDTTGAAVRRFLTDHSRLVPHLPAWRVLGVSPRGQGNLPTSESAFKRAVARTRPSAEDDRAARSELDRYFEVRLAFESDRSTLSIADVNLLRSARLRFIGAEIEQQYSNWCRTAASRARAFRRATQPVLSTATTAYPLTAGEFRSYELPFAYEQFGDLPGVC